MRVSRITVLLYRKQLQPKNNPVILYLNILISQFSNVNNFRQYRIKHCLSVFKIMFQTHFVKGFKFLKKYKCFGRNKRLLTSKLSTVFVIVATQNNYNLFQLSGDLFSIHSLKTVFYTCLDNN